MAILASLYFVVLPVFLSVLLPEFWGSGELSAQLIEWPTPASWHDDTELTDLCFADRDHGWIVGDRGLVLQTSDGGKNWQVRRLAGEPHQNQSPPVSCRLESVVFISPDHGWIAGGYSRPRATTSYGVMFRTTDGGATWQELAGSTLPRIKHLHFFNPRDGIAIGDGNAVKPSGIFRTRDGGRTWSTATQGALSSWTAAAHFGEQTVLAASDGSPALFRDSEISPAWLADSGPVILRQMHLADERFGFAVGDQSQFFQTRNGGLSWHPATDCQGLPAAPVDFNTLCVQGDRVYIAGNPGTRIFSMNTAERVWKAVATPVRNPLSRIHFADADHGWAISSCGDVLHTGDGGESWELQRRGANGVALLQIGQTAASFIPELFSKYCGDDQYIAGALLVRRHAGQAEHPPVSVDALRQALVRAGGCFVHNAVFADPDIEVAQARLKAYLVRQIRTFRPRVIAVPSGVVSGDLPGLRSTILEAVAAAADLQQYPEYESGLGLSPWQVGKVVMVDRGNVGTLKISPAHYMMGLSALISDQAMPSRMLLGQAAIETRPVSLTTIYTSPYAAGPAATLFGNIENTDADVPRRHERRTNAGNLVQMRQLASKQKTLRRFLDSASHPELTAPAWNAGLAELKLQLDDASAGAWLFELASRCDREGYTDLAVETHLYLTSQLRKHPLSVASFRWLFHHFASTEQARLVMSEPASQASAIESVSADAATSSRPVTRIENGIRITEWQVAEEDGEPDVAQTAMSDDSRTAGQRRRFQQARSIMQSFGLVDETALRDNRFQLSRIGLNRRIDRLISVEDQLKQIAVNPLADQGLAELAGLELQILNRRDSAPVPATINCASCTQRPWLDGLLEDAVWRTARQNRSMATLTAASPEATDDRILLASDDQFLYIAVKARKLEGFSYGARADRRPRDSQLLNGDRVEIALDVDRDYCSYFLFSVDSSGRVADSLGDNIHWNPAWYVATSSDQDYWTAEIAIPLDEVTREGDFWAISASRRVRNRLISTLWHTGDPADPPPSEFESLHRAAIEGQHALYLPPLQAFQLANMPWSGERVPTTRALPADQAEDLPADQ